MQFKSNYESTISFTEESFAKLLDKEWSELECAMVDGKTIVLTRTQLIFLWAKTRDWRKVQYSNTKVKVLKVA